MDIQRFDTGDIIMSITVSEMPYDENYHRSDPPLDSGE